MISALLSPSARSCSAESGTTSSSSGRGIATEPLKSGSCADLATALS